MSTPNETQLKTKLLQFFSKHPEEQFKSQVIAHRLGLREQAEIRMLNQVLNEMFQSKAIERGKRKRYGHAAPPPVSQRVSGILSIVKQGNGIVRLVAPAVGTVTINARSLANALHGDEVSVVLFARSAEQKDGIEPPVEGEIVEVIKRSDRPIVGVFEKSKNFFIVSPDDRRHGRDVYIPKEKTKGAKPGQKVVIRIDAWESRAQNPEGHVTEILGTSGDVGAEMTAVAREFQLPLQFPHAVLDETKSISDTIPKEEIKKRLDLRSLVCFTIDPEDAKDFDDAVSLEELPGGDLRLGVHIADVSHYVQEGTALDEEALARGTSVYLADEVIPMLPEKLSNNLCSLRPNEDRLAYTAFVTLTTKGIVKEHQIVRSVIHSKRRFTYEEAQTVIKTGKGDYASVIRLMHELSQTLLKKRMKEGSIDFDSTETKFKFDDQGKPTQIIKKERLDAHRLVEEFMLLANQIVARHIAVPKKDEGPKPFIYRIHDSPPPGKLGDLKSFVELLGYSLNITGGLNSRALQKLLQDIKGKEEENVINEVAIRSMAKAVYSEENVGHFGLGFQYYTHFTSPIRRYPDLMVHRLLNEYEHGMTMKRQQQVTKELPDICKQASDREKVATEAERASVKVMQVEYMKRHVGDEFHAIISGVTNFGMFVEITDLLVEGLIRVRDMDDDYYIFDEKKYALTGRKTRKRYRLGDKVTIRVARVDPEEREIDFTLVQERR